MSAMKKTFLLIGCLGLLVACGKEKDVEVPNENPQEGPERHLIVNITVNQETPDTRAVKTDWEAGDKIYVAFDHYFGEQQSENEGGKAYYMTLTYNGQNWSSTISDPALETYLLSPEHATGRLAAFYADAASPGEETLDFSNFTIENMGYWLQVKNPKRGLVLAVEKEPYSIEEDVLEAVLDMQLPVQNMVHFFIDGVSEEQAARLSLSNEYINPVYVSNFWCSMTETHPLVSIGGDSYGDPNPGAYYQGGVRFCGRLKPEMVDVPTQYVIRVVDNGGTPDDASDDITYTMTKENTALKGLKSVKLPELSSAKWTVTGAHVPIVKFWLDGDPDNTISEVHFDNLFGFAAVIVWPYGFSGEYVTVDVTSDSDEWLWCFNSGGRISLFPKGENPNEQPRVATITVTVTSDDGIDTVTKTFKVYQDGLSSPIRFASTVIKEIAVSKWDTNGDGELSYAEAAAVTSLDGAFSNIPSATVFTFDELQYFSGLTSIGDFEFEFKSLTSVMLPPNITRIGYGAFRGTKIESIALLEGVTELGYFVFENTPLQHLVIPASLKGMMSNPVVGCVDLASITVVADNPVYASPQDCNAIIETDTKTLFAGCQNTVIPDDIETIGYNAFNGCRNLHSIEIPGSVKVIQEYSFAYTGLQSVVIPASVTTIGQRAFYNFDDQNELESIFILATSPQPFTEEMLGLYSETFPIYVPTESVGAFKEAWPDYADRIQGMVSVNFDGYRPEIEW